MKNLSIVPSTKSAVIYARYSSAAQRDASIEQQVKVCRDYAASQGLEVLRIYDDHAMTGTNDSRPAFQQMIKDASLGAFSYVVVYTLDRFSRNQYDAVMNKQKLRERGVRVISATENLQDNPAGHLMETVLEGFAQYFSEELRQKVQRGIRSNAEKCMVIGPTPLGLKKGEDGRYAIVEEEAVIVREIFRRVAAGEPFADVFRDLNARGVKTKKGRDWDRSSFNTLLHNQKYVGVYSYGDIIVPGGIPAILDEEVFAKVQERCLSKAYPRGNPRKRRRENGVFLLTGKAFCGLCKSPMIGDSANGNGGQYFYYTCKRHMDHRDQCRKKSVSREWLEETVAVTLLRILRDPAVVDHLVDSALAYKASLEDTGELQLLADALAAREKEKANVMGFIRRTGGTDSTLAMLKEIEADESSLRAKLSLARDRNASQLTREDVLAVISMVTQGDVKDKAFQERLFDAFLVRVEVYDSEIRIVVNCTANGTDEIVIPFDVESVGVGDCGASLVRIDSPKVYFGTLIRTVEVFAVAGLAVVVASLEAR